MARQVRSSKLENRTARLRLTPRKKPYFAVVAPGIGLGYRRNISGAGTWNVRASDGHGANWLRAFAIADDHEESNAASVMTYWQAVDRARELARAGDTPSSDRLATVAEAIDAYASDLKARGANKGNASMIRFNLPASLASKPVSLLTSKELRGWRNNLVRDGLKPASADRVARVLKAALNLAASDDPRITNVKAWRNGLKRLPDGENSRNTILPDEVVRSIIRTAYEVDHYLGVWIETLAGTGARESQVLGLEIADLQDSDPTSPRLMLPTSKKGKSRRVERRALPISPSLAAVLRQAAAGRPRHAPLLEKIPQIYRPFRTVTERLGLDQALTPYALRHSSIVRQLMAGTPTRVVAAAHDTSVAMIEATYSRFIIGDASDTVLRRGLLDMTAPAANVVPIGRRL